MIVAYGPQTTRRPTWQCPKCKATWQKTPTELSRRKVTPTCPLDGAELTQIEKRANR